MYHLKHLADHNTSYGIKRKYPYTFYIPQVTTGTRALKKTEKGPSPCSYLILLQNLIEEKESTGTIILLSQRQVPHPLQDLQLFPFLLQIKVIPLEVQDCPKEMPKTNLWPKDRC